MNVKRELLATLDDKLSGLDALNEDVSSKEVSPITADRDRICCQDEQIQRIRQIIDDAFLAAAEHDADQAEALKRKVASRLARSLMNSVVELPVLWSKNNK